MTSTRIATILLGWLIVARGAFAAEPTGNVAVSGDDLRVTVPPAWRDWKANDVDGNDVGHGAVRDGKAELGKLPVGFYEVFEVDGMGPVTAGVVAKNAPVDTTPIAIDVAASWFWAEPEKIREACRLAKLGGVKWVRDRASWPELESARGTFAGETRYERSMRIQHEMGLKILQVNHASPAWANKNSSKFPEDLRDAFNFYREYAKRWKGLADAFEPWNEPDIDVFGGHTGCEIASFHKAAALGLKAGDPQTPICGTVFAIDRAETLEEFGTNETYPYFDRYDLHHYIRLDEYARAYGRHRAVNGGRPMWTTEFNLTVQWEDEKTKEPSHDELRVQGYRVGKVFAHALYEGSEKAFYFILGDYVERDRQYGLLHADLTPRPAYVAFAAVGRLLNGAVPIGRVDFGDDKLKGFLFSTKVDGADCETLVAWSETTPISVKISEAEKVYDYLGREMPPGEKLELDRPTVFAVFPKGASKQFKIQPPPAKTEMAKGTASPVVLQLVGPTDFKKSAYQLDKSNQLKLIAYNFGDQPARGTFKVEGATGIDGEIQLAPGARDERTIEVNGDARTIRVQLDLGNNLGRPIVSARIGR